MVRKLVLAGVAGAVAFAGLAVAGDVASAAKPTITAGPGSSVTCTMQPSAAKLKPALKDNWVAAAHASDPWDGVAALPDTTLALPGPVAVKLKVKSLSCTGTVTDGTNTAPVTSLQVSLGNDPANPGSTNPATCAGLVAPDPENPSTARYNATLKWKATGAKVTDTTITGSQIGSAGGNFSISGGTITGSFAGGSSSTTGSPDLETVAAFFSSTAFQPNLVTSATPDAGGPCQGSLKIKLKKGVETATLKAGKGVKKIGLAGGTFTIAAP